MEELKRMKDPKGYAEKEALKKQGGQPDMFGVPGEASMDAATFRHFEAWLERTVPERERETIKSRIVDILADDPGLIDKGWPFLWDLARQMDKQARSLSTVAQLGVHA